MGIFSSIIAIILGLIMIISPSAVYNSLMPVLGIALIVLGVFAIFLFIKKKITSVWTLVLSIVAVILGIIVLIWQQELIKYTLMLVGALMIIWGIIKLVQIIRYDKAVKAAKDLYIYPSVVIVVGIVLLFLPSTSEKLLVITLGIGLLVYGISELMTTLRISPKKVESVEKNSE